MSHATDVTNAKIITLIEEGEPLKALLYYPVLCVLEAQEQREKARELRVAMATMVLPTFTELVVQSFDKFVFGKKTSSGDGSPEDRCCR